MGFIKGVFKVAFGIVFAIVILVVVCVAIGTSKSGQHAMQHVEDDVAADAVRQYEIAKRNGTKMDACVQAGFVTAAYLQAKNESEYARWQEIKKADCARAGL